MQFACVSVCKFRSLRTLSRRNPYQRKCLCASGEQDLHSRPYACEQFGCPVVLQARFVTPVTERRIDEVVVDILQQLEVHAAFEIPDSCFVLLKNFEEVSHPRLCKMHPNDSYNHLFQLIPVWGRMIMPALQWLRMPPPIDDLRVPGDA